ncbi:hypothetical protein MTR67_013129 [Solanum verrucosum]|uniref:Uncharacterized protein n=1 Tax=Solanum verrucosum TaxID=315347 RepID=A0AAF0QGZ8_SOLVR|nr:hypothetical protein MTR67_013129 [Solanum verrucosum]
MKSEEVICLTNFCDDNELPRIGNSNYVPSVNEEVLGHNFQVNFNPVTVNSIKKTLAAICKKEQREVSADSLVKVSGGDIRHVINSLQYLCLKPHIMPILSSKERLDNVSCLDDVFCLSFDWITLVCLFDVFCFSFGKDETTSLFYALGKFLHNKRE